MRAQVVVDDWSSGAAEPVAVTLALDPMLPPQEQAATLYKK